MTAAPEDERFIPERSALEAALLRELAETWDEIADNHFNKPGTLGGFPDPPAMGSGGGPAYARREKMGSRAQARGPRARIML